MRSTPCAVPAAIGTTPSSTNAGSQHSAGGLTRVVFAWRGSAVFVDCHGAEELEAAGVEAVEVPELADAVRDINAHLPQDRH